MVLTYWKTDAILLDLVTDTDSNHTWTPDSAATEEQNKKLLKQQILN